MLVLVEQGGARQGGESSGRVGLEIASAAQRSVRTPGRSQKSACGWRGVAWRCGAQVKATQIESERGARAQSDAVPAELTRRQSSCDARGRGYTVTMEEDDYSRTRER